VAAALAEPGGIGAEVARRGHAASRLAIRGSWTRAKWSSKIGTAQALAGAYLPIWLIESAPMRRRLVVLMLLLVLPLQFVWAAAAPYCAHEAASAAGKHPGHHQHVHQGSDDAAKAGDDGAGSGLNHSDCAGCHAGAAATLPRPAVEWAAAPRDVPREPPSPRYRSHTPSGPERPDIV
jgi:hypothetical protein